VRLKGASFQTAENVAHSVVFENVKHLLVYSKIYKTNIQIALILKYLMADALQIKNV